MKKVILLVVLLLTLTGCFNSDSKKFKEEYEALNSIENEDGTKRYFQMSLDTKNPIKYLEIEEVFEFFESGTGFIYIGRPACPWCRIAVPVMFEASEEYNFKKIYYYDIEQIRNDNTEDYQKLVNILYDYLPIDTVTQSEDDEDFDINLKRIVVPDFYSVKEGNIISNHQNTVESHTDFREDLNEVQKEELKLIFKNMFEEVK